MNKNIFVTLALILVLFSNTVLGAGWTVEDYYTHGISTPNDALIAPDIDGTPEEAIYISSGSTGYDVYQLKWSDGLQEWQKTTVFNSSSYNLYSLNTGNLNGGRPNAQLYVTRDTTTNSVYEVYYDGGWLSQIIDPATPGNARDSIVGDGRGTGTDYLYVTDSSGAITEYEYSGGWAESEVTSGVITGQGWGIAIADADPAATASKQLYVIDNGGSLYQIQWNGSSWDSAVEILSGMTYGRHIHAMDIDNDGLDELIWNYPSSSNAHVYIAEWDDSQSIWVVDIITDGSDYAYCMGQGDGNNDGSDDLYYGSGQYWGGIFLHDPETGTNSRDHLTYWSGNYFYCPAVGDADNDGENEVYWIGHSNLFQASANPTSVSIPATRQNHDSGVGCDYYTDEIWTSSYFSPVYSNTTYWIDNTPSDNDFTWSTNTTINPGAGYTQGVDTEYWHTNKPICATTRYTSSGNYYNDHKFPGTHYWGTDYVLPLTAASREMYVVGLQDNTTYDIIDHLGAVTQDDVAINAGERDEWTSVTTWDDGYSISATKPVAVYLRFSSPVIPTDKLGQSFFIPPHHATIGRVFASPSQDDTTVYVDADNDGVADETHVNVDLGSSVIITLDDPGTHVYADKPIHLGMDTTGAAGHGWNDVLPVESLGNAYFIGLASQGGTTHQYAMAIEPDTNVESHREQAIYDSTTLTDFGDYYNLGIESRTSTIFGDKPFWYGHYYPYGSGGTSASVSAGCVLSQVAENRLSPRIAALGELQTYKARLFTMDVDITDINGTFYIPEDYTLQGGSGVTVTVAKYGALNDGFVESETAELTIPAAAGGKFTLQLDTADAASTLDGLLVDQYIEVSFDVSPNTASVYEIEPAEFGYTADTYSYSEPFEA